MLRSLKERKRTEHSEWKRMQCPTLTGTLIGISDGNTVVMIVMSSQTNKTHWTLIGIYDGNSNDSNDFTN